MSEIRNVTSKSRYEVLVDGLLAGHADYLVHGEHVVITHTETDPARSGQGLASALTEGVLVDIRAQGRRLVAQCSFTAAYVAKHAQWHDLLAQD